MTHLRTPILTPLVNPPKLCATQIMEMQHPPLELVVLALPSSCVRMTVALVTAPDTLASFLEELTVNA